MSHRKIFGAVTLAAFLFSSTVFSADLPQNVIDAERLRQQETAHLRKPLPADKKLQHAPEAKSFREKLYFYYTLLEGYDRNVLLNASHKGSLYTEQIGAITYTDRYEDFLIYRLSYHATYLNYYKFGGETFWNQGPGVETAFKLKDTLFLETDYHFRLFERPHDAQANFTKHDAKIGLKHEIILGKFYQKPSFIFDEHHYTKMKVRDSAANVPSPSEDREDVTLSFDYELGYQPTHQLLFQVHNRFGHNDSNDLYRDFYDYDYYRFMPIVIWHITKPLLLITGAEYQRNFYDDRDFSGKNGRENLYAFFGSLNYEINPNTALTFCWNYIKDDNSIPELEYQDSLLSAGVLFHF